MKRANRFSSFRVPVSFSGRLLVVRHSSSATATRSRPETSFCPDLTTSNALPFARARLGNFYETPPELRNQFDEDPILRRYLAQRLPAEILAAVEPDLRNFGGRVVDDLLRLHRECEINLPRLESFDAWGRRTDRLVTCEAWREMKRISAEEGLVAIGYENQFGEWSRLYQMAKLLLFAASAGLYSCPLAMTDGAAKILTEKDPGSLHPDLASALGRLTNRDPQKFWTSGQWMTERKGGSDVASGCETKAFRQSDGTFHLYGYKWFSSATDSDMALTLARIVDDDGEVELGTRGLSLFYLETHENSKGSANPSLNGIEVVRLKNKLGTRQVPTAELLLDGSRAMLVSQPGRGVAEIAPMLAVTRLHNSVSAASSMRRVVNVAKDYASKRMAFGRKIIDHPLHAQTLAGMELEARACSLLTLELATLLGKAESAAFHQDEDASTISRSVSLLRILTPLTKLYTAKCAINCISEGLESLGGQGYIEDTGMPTYFRDAQVLSIWEGTTNVLSLDVLRCVSKSRGNDIQELFLEVEEKLTKNRVSSLTRTVEKVRTAVSEVADWFPNAAADPSSLEASARDLSYVLSRIFAASLFVELANATGRELDVEIAKRWVALRDLNMVVRRFDAGNYETVARDVDREIASNMTR